MNSPVTTEALITMEYGGAADTHDLGLVDEPFADRLVLMLTVLQRIEIDLIAHHNVLLDFTGQFPGHETGNGGDDGGADMDGDRG